MAPNDFTEKQGSATSCRSRQELATQIPVAGRKNLFSLENSSCLFFPRCWYPDPLQQGKHRHKKAAKGCEGGYCRKDRQLCTAAHYGQTFRRLIQVLDRPNPSGTTGCQPPTVKCSDWEQTNSTGSKIPCYCLQIDPNLLFEKKKKDTILKYTVGMLYFLLWKEESYWQFKTYGTVTQSIYKTAMQQSENSPRTDWRVTWIPWWKAIPTNRSTTAVETFHSALICKK